MYCIGTLFFTIFNLLGHDENNVMLSDHMNNENTGRKHNYIGFTGAHYVFACDWCKEFQGASGSVNTHMHNTCKKTPNPLMCLECSDRIELKNFTEIYNHYLATHSSKANWKCPACAKYILKRNFISHYGSLTHVSHAHIFDGFNPPKDFKIGHVLFSKLRKENKINARVQATSIVHTNNSAESNLHKLSIEYILCKSEDDAAVFSIRDMSGKEHDSLQ